jgi:hypothetical protein
MWNQPVVGDVTQCLVKGAEARLKEFVKIFNNEDRRALMDTAFDMHSDEGIEVFDWGARVFTLEDQ